MGGRQSVYLFNPPKVDPMFKDIGCVGLKRDDYGKNGAGKIIAPPFYYKKFVAKTYNDIQNEIINTLREISPITPIQPPPDDMSYLNEEVNTNTSQGETSAPSPATSYTAEIVEEFASKQNVFVTLKNLVLKRKQQQEKNAQSVTKKNVNPPTGDGNVYGPVYFLVAQSQVDKTFEGYLYFPSMTKDMKRYRNYIQLGMAHRWMRTFLYSRTFSRRPVGLIPRTRESTKCEIYNYTSQTSRRTGGLFNRGSVITRAGDPLKYGCTTDTTNNNSDVTRRCMESEQILREQGTYKTGAGFDNKSGIDYGTDVISAEKSYYPAVYFHTYRIDTNHVSISPYMNKNGFDHLILNIVVSGMEMFSGCDYMLISPNKRILFKLNENSLSLYVNTVLTDPSRVIIQKMPKLTPQMKALLQRLGRNIPNVMQKNLPSNPLIGKNAEVNLSQKCYDEPKFMDKMMILRKYNFNGTGDRYIIEENMLNVYALDIDGVENVAFSIEAINPKVTSEPPYALLIDNMGHLRVYDNNDKEVTSPIFKNAFSFEGQPNEDGTLNDGQNINDINQTNNDFSDEYDPNADYRRRFLNLVAYLQFKGLLKELIGLNDDLLPDDNKLIFRQTYDSVAIYDSNQDFVQRIIDLVNFIEVHYHTTIDQSFIDAYLQSKGMSIPEEDIAKESQKLYENVPTYNQENDNVVRIQDLKKYMRQYNILKDQAIYDDKELNKQMNDLPITSQIDNSQYNTMADYEARYMNLKSHYPLAGFEEEMNI
jgi:hypothetical protein